MPGTPDLEGLMQSGGGGGAGGYTPRGLDGPDWRGHLRSPGQARLLGRGSVAPETVSGQAGSGGWNCQLLSGRSLVAAQPTASSMETARQLRLKVPPAGHCSPPYGLALCVSGRVQGPAVARGRAGPACALTGHGSSPNDPPHQPLSPVPISALCLGFQAPSPDPRLSAWPPGTLGPGWTASRRDSPSLCVDPGTPPFPVSGQPSARPSQSASPFLGLAPGLGLPPESLSPDLGVCPKGLRCSPGLAVLGI